MRLVSALLAVYSVAFGHAVRCLGSAFIRVPERRHLHGTRHEDLAYPRCHYTERLTRACQWYVAWLTGPGCV